MTIYASLIVNVHASSSSDDSIYTIAYATGTYGLFVACATLVLAPFPLAVIPGFFAFCGGIASGIEATNCDVRLYFPLF